MISSLLFALLPPALLGCGLIGGPDCEGPTCADDSGGDTTPDTFIASARMYAPYGWTGDFYVAQAGDTSNLVCEDVMECIFEPEDPDTYRLILTGDLFLCVSQETDLTEVESDTVSDFTWEGEGQCGLAPDGEYGGWDVETDELDNKIWMLMDTLMAPITKDSFYFEDDVYLLEGTVSSDLASISYHFHSYATDLDETATITLQ